MGLSVGVAFFLMFFGFMAPLNSWAQEGSGGEPDYEVGLHMGRLLPNQIGGVTEIIPQWGGRLGYRLGTHFFGEVGGTTGAKEGVEYQNVHLSARLDVPVETLVGEVFLGGDVTRYKATTGPRKIFGGGHIGGGILTHIADAIWFRTDMKFNINPGTSLYFGFGFMVRL